MSTEVIVLARAPGGEGKSRLCAGLRAGSARRLREALFLDTLEAALGAGSPVTIALTPVDEVDDTRTLVTRDRTLAASADTLTWRTQVDGDIGARMAHALEQAFAAGATHAVLIGSDLPSLPPAHISRALDELGRADGADVVLGPATDGGYYLVGVRTGAATLATLFADVPWGTAAVFGITRDRAAALGISVDTVPAWFDADTRDDLRRIVGAPGVAAPRTRAWAAGHWRAAQR